jgi:phosphatidylserine synthase
MRVELFMWFIGVVVFWIIIWRVTKNWSSPTLGVVRAAVRSFAVSLALAPTGISAGYVGFPAPASAVILSYLFDTHRDNPGLIANIRFAVVCFLVFWAVGFFISLALFYRRQKRHE